MAQHLLQPPNGPPPEASFRSAAGRAYYAAFGHSKEVLKSRGFRFSGSHDEHQVLIRFLKKSRLPYVAAAGSDLDDLRSKRNSADYDVGSERVRRGPFNNWSAQLAAAQAANVTKAIDRGAASDTRLGIP